MDALEQAIARGARAWPGVQVSSDELAAHLRATLEPGTDVETALPALAVEDLYLACACAAGDPRATSLFKQTYLPLVAGYVARVTRVRAEVDEIGQRLLERVLVPPSPGVRPRIREYGGRGPLGAWLRVVALRQALDLKRSQRPATEAAIDDDLRSPGADPELAYFKARYRAEFKQAFEATLAELPAEQRTLLKLHYLDGLNIDEIGLAFRVHRSTVARWIAQAREAIVEDTRRRLTQRSGLQGAELDSLLGLVRSQLDVSIARYLVG